MFKVSALRIVPSILKEVTICWLDSFVTFLGKLDDSYLSGCFCSYFLLPVWLCYNCYYPYGLYIPRPKHFIYIYDFVTLRYLMKCYLSWQKFHKNYVYCDSEKKVIRYCPSMVKHICYSQFRILCWVVYTGVHYLVIQWWN